MLRWRLLLGTLIIAALVALCWLDNRATAMPGVWLHARGYCRCAVGHQGGLGLGGGGRNAPAAMDGLCRQCPAGGQHLAGHADGIWRKGLPLNVAYRRSLGEIVVLSALAVAVLLVFLGEMWRYKKPGGNTANLAAGVFALVYVGLMLWFAVQLRIVWGVGALAAWVIVVKMGDTGAYTVGRLIGRHKMAPLISPGKTIEGAVGALVFSCLGSWAAFKWIVPLAMKTRAVKPALVGMDRFRPAGRCGRHVGRSGRVVSETRRRRQGFQHVDARLRRRVGHSRLAAALRPGGVVLLGIRAGRKIAGSSRASRFYGWNRTINRHSTYFP